MKAITRSTRLAAALLLIFCAARGADPADDSESEMLTLRSLPLILENGGFSYVSVPMRLHGSDLSEWGDAMSAPVYVASKRESDRTKDINLISCSGIKISFKAPARKGDSEADDELDVFIDVSHFKQPENVGFKEYGIVEAIVAGVRSNPPRMRSKMNVKVVGAPDPSVFAKLEGPVRTPSLMMLESVEGFHESADSAKEFFILNSLYMPLVVEGRRVEICWTPAKFRFEAAHASIDAFKAPVYAVSTKEIDRKRDINLVSLSKIDLSLEYLKPDGWMTYGSESNLVIDVSHFIQPQNVDLEIYDILQILTALRMNRPPSSDGKINVRIVGAADPTLFTALDGPLWRSGYQKPEGK